MKKVYIYQRVIPHYRVVFFDELYKKLFANQVELKVVYGKEFPGTVPKSIMLEKPWACYKPNFYIKFLNKELVFQTPVFSSLFDKSVIVTEQANRLLINYLFLFLKFISHKKIAFWGHGKNFQSIKPDSYSEKLKKLISRNVDWWFCYTNQGKEIITNNGVEESKITVVYNSVDTKNLSASLSKLSSENLNDLTSNLSISSKNIALYCGGMYTEKRIPFLLQACLEIKNKILDFEMIFIGDGPDVNFVKEFCERHSWAHYVGEISGDDKVKYFAISKCQLMPGLVGLGVLDSFALLTPLITTEFELHSPEIAYLKSNSNGLITENTLEQYVNGVVSVLRSNKLLTTLTKGCLSSRDIYSLDKMVNSFSQGLISFIGLK